MRLGPSELILNADGSIYHLNLRPEDIAHTIITVGDPDRVDDVSKYFDAIEVKRGKKGVQNAYGHAEPKKTFGCIDRNRNGQHRYRPKRARCTCKYRF